MINTKAYFFRQILATILFSLFIQGTYAQNGIPFITFLDSQEGYEAKNWAICQDDHNAMLFASRKGLLRYDGSEWRAVNIPYIPNKIKQNPENLKVYIVSEKNYGYLERDKKGLQYYEALTFENELEHRINNILFTDTTVIFYGEYSISCHSITDHQLIYRHTSNAYGSFMGIINNPGQTFVKIRNKGLFIVSKDTLVSAGIKSWNADGEILFSFAHNNEECIIGTSTGRLLLFDGKTFSDFKLSNPDYLLENGLIDGLELNDSTYVFASLYGGVILVNKKNGKVIYTLNYESGLPDDEIYSIGKDRNNGLWLTYGFGSCRVDLNIQVKDYSHYPGIEGLLTNAIWYLEELYISTTEGLFYLSEVKNYEEVEIYLKRAIATTEEKVSRRRKNRTTSTKSEDEKGFFSRLFSRNKKEEAGTPVIKNSEKTIPAQTQYVRKKVSKLKSIEHVFKKVNGLNSRCEQLMASDNGMLVGSSSGLYLINNHVAERISDLRNIRFIADKNNSGIYYILSEERVSGLKFDAGKPIVSSNNIPVDDALFSIWVSDSTYWLSGFDVVYKAEVTYPDSVSMKTYIFESVYPEELHLANINDTLFLFSGSTIHYYANEVDSFLIYHAKNPDLQNFSNLLFFPAISGQQWLKSDQKIVCLNDPGNERQQEIWGLFRNITSFYTKEGAECWLIDDYSKIYQINVDYPEDSAFNLEVFIESISNESGDYFDLSDLSFDPSEKMVKIQVSAPYFLRNQSTSYQYKVEEKMLHWSSWSLNSSLDILLDPGEYRVLIRASNIMGEISDPISVSFVIRKPFYQANWFYISLIPLVLGLLYLLVYARERKLRRDKQILEHKIEERTIEIRKQTRKIEIQKDEILAQKNDITSSITYASRIQKAILPSTKVFEKTFSGFFIYYKPRDIVSGDFYWVNETKDDVIFAVADCTGHGVPGAFMSMLGNSFLNEITKGDGSDLPVDHILNQLRDMINTALTQSGENTSANDGMDITLCKYNKKKSEIEFSGAFNPLYLVRDRKLVEYKADRMPIGFHPKKKDFTSQTIQMKKNDVIYLFSDGFQDQFGGESSKKYSSKQFKETLTALSGFSMDEQHAELEKVLVTWRGDNQQIDDILIVGIRI